MSCPPPGASLPIADYAFLSDCHRGALVSRGGSVDWMCAPRFDSPALFGRLLELSSFRQSLDENELDAAALLIPIVGFLPVDDPRVRATIRAIEERLTAEHGLVFRYLADDGLPAAKGRSCCARSGWPMLSRWPAR